MPTGLILNNKSYVSSSCVFDLKKKISPQILDRTVFDYNVDDFYPQVVHDTIRFPNAVGSQGIICNKHEHK